MDRGSLTVTVTGGRVRGVIRRGLRMWRGIPYAAPTSGPNRFRSPRPVEPWEGTRDATDFGPIAPQDRRILFPGRSGLVDSSEDCLNLNVIAPQERSEGLRPVMVYVHGGAYAVGSSREMPQQGEGLVREGGVVFVNLNYRLGALGFLDFAGFSTSDRPIENNLGLRDIVAALEWVRDNIRAFGGDPGNVTLFGESAGANAVTTLMCVPAARGLFARAIAESPPAEAVYDAEVTARWGEDFVRMLAEVVGGPATASGAAELLQAATVEQLVTATARLVRATPDRVPGTIALCPTIDGDFLPTRPIHAFAEGTAHPIPLIIGTNEREGSLFRGRLDILATTPTRIQGIFVKTYRPFARGLAAQYPHLPTRRGRADFAGDYAFWYPSIEVAEGHSRFAPVHFYRFDIAPRLARMLGLDATHGIELFAVFDRARTPFGLAMGALGGYRDFERTGRRMRINWLRFARDGSVDAGWPAYTEHDRATLIIDADDRIEWDPHAERRLAWREFVPHI
ncbi:carboxylesterase/lipase family protein [Lysinimonas soli]|uniref:Carboxylic ester hydrolase n=1 Tax=Lysinimonas soli TaxID=1074233 RepID=A0ABW0NN23_9MICO